jgi:predicted ABC-type transport system involved in lysophospholipase L1 biosynthesis ATPase subunit
MSLLSFRNVSVSVRDGPREVPVLEEVSFEIDAGDYVGLWSGRRTGKSTLLRLAAGVEVPDSGEILFDGADLVEMSKDRRAHLRRRGGIALALADWSPAESRPVVEHVAFPLAACGVSFHDAERVARRTLKRVGAADVEDIAMNRLKLSERVRVELARALVREPRLLLVDEPAVLASPREGRELYELLRSLGRDRSLAVVVASEQSAAIEGAPRVFTLSGGRIHSTDSRRKVLPFRRTAGETSGQ